MILSSFWLQIFLCVFIQEIKGILEYWNMQFVGLLSCSLSQNMMNVFSVFILLHIELFLSTSESNKHYAYFCIVFAGIDLLEAEWKAILLFFLLSF